ncbi:hypothetical protein [Caulobacter sp. DWR1-3-2b1]|uniref:hypothetical protein n=1 Tax=Caulobacter sp. DWR1-3-2b1 TaxID=2804670 RepID=UPI003CF1F2D2
MAIDRAINVAADIPKEAGLVGRLVGNTKLPLAKFVRQPQVADRAAGQPDPVVHPLDLPLQRAPLPNHVGGGFQVRLPARRDERPALGRTDPILADLQANLGPAIGLAGASDGVQLGVFRPDHPRQIADPGHQFQAPRTGLLHTLLGLLKVSPRPRLGGGGLRR